MIDDFEYSSSSSMDRSSIGSIPWADDAMKRNQLEWERVERLIAGVEDALPEESELAKEIREWQLRFPQLIDKKSILSKEQSFNSSTLNYEYSVDLDDNDSISNLSLNSLDNDYGEDDNDFGNFDTPTRDAILQHDSYSGSKRGQVESQTRQHQRSSFAVNTNDANHLHGDVAANELADFFNKDLHIRSVPLMSRQIQTKSQRTNAELISDFVQSDSSSSSVYAIPPPPPPRKNSPLFNVPVAKSKNISSASAVRAPPLRMPPILNVIESTRCFRNLTKNRSFVPLSQIQYVKSAAVTQHPRSSAQPVRTRTPNQLAIGRANNNFANNRNAIILPALNLQRIREHNFGSNNRNAAASVLADDVGMRSYSNSSQSSSGSIVGRRQQKFVPHWNFNSTTTTSTVTASSNGRSVSALHHPRMEFNALYLPYSASKFKFK